MGAPARAGHRPQEGGSRAARSPAAAMMPKGHCAVQVTAAQFPGQDAGLRRVSWCLSQEAGCGEAAGRWRSAP
ncbi:hypothetical protein VULLAG_LOCUS6543 [Vulpes lagopus]